MPAKRHSQPIEANVAQPEGCYWQTIILLLAGKLKAEDGDTGLEKIGLFEKSE